MPHFGWSTKVNACVRQLLVSFHGGCLWLKIKHYVDVKLIATITRIPLAGVDPMPFFKKYQDTLMTNKLKDKYDLTRDTRGFLIAFFNDYTIQFATKFLATKLVWKMWLNQCTTGTIAMVELCVGVQMNWSHYLLNEWLSYAEDSQEKGNTLHYSWLLILILFCRMGRTIELPGIDILVLCRGDWYQNI